MSFEETYRIGGELEVGRLGFGAMRITGAGVWGHPEHPERARELCRRVAYLGINLIDTADAYGPEVSEYLLAEALAPYPDTMVIATKGGLTRGGPGQWVTDGRPEHLKRACANSLRRLRLDAIDLYQLHAVDDDVPFLESVGALADLKADGLIRHVGLSNVTVEQIEQARAVVDIASVQNRYNLLDRTHQPVLDFCHVQGIAFIPWYPLKTGELSAPGGVLSDLARKHRCTPSQLALAWLLHLSPVVLPIPGTSSIAHLEENTAARELRLDVDDVAELTALGG